MRPDPCGRQALGFPWFNHRTLDEADEFVWLTNKLAFGTISKQELQRYHELRKRPQEVPWKAAAQ